MVKVSVLGGSGYVGGELLRLLLSHPEVELTSVISRTYSEKYLFKIHPNLRGLTKIKFSPLNPETLAQDCDIIFTATPHGSAMNYVPKILEQGVKVIDMSADYRLKKAEDYLKWYGWEHKNPNLLKEAVYGLPELHRDQIKTARLVACSGCMATATILALAPPVKKEIIEEKRIVVDVKIGSSGAGVKPTVASHHPERSGGVRPYKVVGHRHIAEIEQELTIDGSQRVTISFTPHAVGMVRGIMATIHTFPKKLLTIPDIWKMYREFYEDEPFVRLVKDREGLYQLPNPKILHGSNYCDIGFDLDPHANRLILFSAIDNLVKGASGQGIQCMNLMFGLDESAGIKGAGVHPV